MNEIIMEQNLGLCPHGKRKGMCDICDNKEDNKAENTREIPEGAITQADLAKELMVDASTIAKRAKKYGQDLPKKGSVKKRDIYIIQKNWQIEYGKI